MLARLTLSLAVLALSACAASSPRTDAMPDWVEGASARYPSAQYLLGRGMGSDQAQAQDRARADLAKVFAVSVHAESQDTQSFDRTQGTHAQVTRVTATQTDQVLQGVQVGDLWRDPKTGTHHALAVLARGPAAMRLREEIARLDSATQADITHARAQEDLFAKIAAASDALAAQQARVTYQQTLRIIDLAGRGSEPQWSVEQLSADLASLLARVHINAQAPNAPEGFSSALAAAVAVAGFTPEKEAGSAYVLEGTLALDDEGVRDGWFWTRGTLHVRLLDAQGRARGAQQWTVKGSGQQPQTARTRALSEASDVLKRELRATVLGFALH